MSARDYIFMGMFAILIFPGGLIIPLLQGVFS